MVQHDRRYGREVDKTGVPLQEPDAESRVHLFLQSLDALARFCGNGSVLSVGQYHQLRPYASEVKPLHVPCILCRNGWLKAFDELGQATRPVRGRIGSNADVHPRIGKGICLLVRYGMEQSIEKQVIDVNTDVMMLEGKIDGSLYAQSIGFFAFAKIRIPFGSQAIKEDRPTFLEKAQKCFPVRNKGFKWPIVEGIVLAQELNEPFVEDGRDSLTTVMTAQ